MQGGQSDEVVFVIGVEVEDGVADLLDVDGAAERGLLGVVARQTNALGFVPD